MRKIILSMMAALMLMTAAPLPASAGFETLQYNLNERLCVTFDCCGGMFGLLFGYRNYSGYREFGFYDSDGDWHCMWLSGYNC